MVRFRQNDLAGAERYLRDALEMEVKALGPNDLLVAMVSNNLADVVQAAGRHDEAFGLRRRNTEIRLNNELEALRAHPDVVSHLGAAADLYVRRGEFDKARQMLDEAARRDPNDPQRLMVAACLRYYVRDEPGYREACAAVLGRFADTTDAEDAAWAARACALSPKFGGDADLVAKLADRGYAGGQTPFSRLSKGLVELRAGHFDLAERCLNECLGSNPSDAHRAAAGFYLSEALRLKGDAPGAAAAMEKASEVFNRLPKMEDGDVGTDPEEWMFAQIAARQARAGSGAPAPPADHGSK
jgi:tetratricopeptide (TPR) repeat protein